MRTKLRIARIKLGIKQIEVASAVKVSPVYYSLIESGKRDPSEDIWRRIQKTLYLTDRQLTAIRKEK